MRVFNEHPTNPDVLDVSEEIYYPEPEDQQRLDAIVSGRYAEPAKLIDPAGCTVQNVDLWKQLIADLTWFNRRLKVPLPPATLRLIRFRLVSFLSSSQSGRSSGKAASPPTSSSVRRARPPTTPSHRRSGTFMLRLQSLRFNRPTVSTATSIELTASDCARRPDDHAEPLRCNHCGVHVRSSFRFSLSPNPNPKLNPSPKPNPNHPKNPNLIRTLGSPLLAGILRRP